MKAESVAACTFSDMYAATAGKSVILRGRGRTQGLTWDHMTSFINSDNKGNWCIIFIFMVVGGVKPNSTTQRVEDDRLKREVVSHSTTQLRWVLSPWVVRCVSIVV
jgi:hypothetical protein